MKGHDSIINHLNLLLRDELTAVNQYFVHAEMCENWGYEKLHNLVEKRSIAEMRHAEKIIKRILYLEGQPVMTELNQGNIGSVMEDQFRKDLDAEAHGIKNYNDGIKLAAELGDNGTKDLLEGILVEEEKHLDWLESQLTLIEQMGIQNYLSAQIADSKG